MWLPAIKFFMNPKTIALMIIALLAGTIMFLHTQKLGLQNDIVVLKNTYDILQSHNQKCFSERELIVEDTKQQNKIINALRANLKAQQDNCAEVTQEYEKVSKLLSEAGSVPTDTLIKTGRVVDEKASSDVVKFILRLF